MLNLIYRNIFLFILIFLFGCSAMKIEDFANTNPEFKLMEFFEGNVKAWGIVEDRFGNIRRQFKYEITKDAEIFIKKNL